MSAPGDAVNPYVVSLCDDCLNGAGGECHTPGCAIWMGRAPDTPIRVEGPAASVVPACYARVSDVVAWLRAQADIAHHVPAGHLRMAASGVEARFGAKSP